MKLNQYERAGLSDPRDYQFKPRHEADSVFYTLSGCSGEEIINKNKPNMSWSEAAVSTLRDIRARHRPLDFEEHLGDVVYKSGVCHVNDRRLDYVLLFNHLTKQYRCDVHELYVSGNHDGDCGWWSKFRKEGKYDVRRAMTFAFASYFDRWDTRTYDTSEFYKAFPSGILDFDYISISRPDPKVLYYRRKLKFEDQLPTNQFMPSLVYAIEIPEIKTVKFYLDTNKYVTDYLNALKLNKVLGGLFEKNLEETINGVKLKRIEELVPQGPGNVSLYQEHEETYLGLKVKEFKAMGGIEKVKLLVPPGSVKPGEPGSIKGFVYRWRSKQHSDISPEERAKLQIFESKMTAKLTLIKNYLSSGPYKGVFQEDEIEDFSTIEEIFRAVLSKRHFNQANWLKRRVGEIKRDNPDYKIIINGHHPILKTMSKRLYQTDASQYLTKEERQALIAHHLDGSYDTLLFQFIAEQSGVDLDDLKNMSQETYQALVDEYLTPEKKEALLKRANTRFHYNDILYKIIIEKQGIVPDHIVAAHDHQLSITQQDISLPLEEGEAQALTKKVTQVVAGGGGGELQRRYSFDPDVFFHEGYGFWEVRQRQDGTPEYTMCTLDGFVCRRDPNNVLEPLREDESPEVKRFRLAFDAARREYYQALEVKQRASKGRFVSRGSSHYKLTRQIDYLTLYLNHEHADNFDITVAYVNQRLKDSPKIKAQELNFHAMLKQRLLNEFGADVNQLYVPSKYVTTRAREVIRKVNHVGLENLFSEARGESQEQTQAFRDLSTRLIQSRWFRLRLRFNRKLRKSFAKQLFFATDPRRHHALKLHANARFALKQLLSTKSAASVLATLEPKEMTTLLVAAVRRNDLRLARQLFGVLLKNRRYRRAFFSGVDGQANAPEGELSPNKGILASFLLENRIHNRELGLKTNQDVDSDVTRQDVFDALQQTLQDYETVKKVIHLGHRRRSLSSYQIAQLAILDRSSMAAMDLMKDKISYSVSDKLGQDSRALQLLLETFYDRSLFISKINIDQTTPGIIGRIQDWYYRIKRGHNYRYNRRTNRYTFREALLRTLMKIRENPEDLEAKKLALNMCYHFAVRKGADYYTINACNELGFFLKYGTGGVAPGSKREDAMTGEEARELLVELLTPPPDHIKVDYELTDMQRLLYLLVSKLGTPIRDYVHLNGKYGAIDYISAFHQAADRIIKKEHIHVLLPSGPFTFPKPLTKKQCVELGFLLKRLDPKYLRSDMGEIDYEVYNSAPGDKEGNKDRPTLFSLLNNDTRFQKYIVTCMKNPHDAYHRCVINIIVTRQQTYSKKYYAIYEGYFKYRLQHYLDDFTIGLRERGVAITGLWNEYVAYLNTDISIGDITRIRSTFIKFYLEPIHAALGEFIQHMRAGVDYTAESVERLFEVREILCEPVLAGIVSMLVDKDRRNLYRAVGEGLLDILFKLIVSVRMLRKCVHIPNLSAYNAELLSMLCNLFAYSDFHTLENTLEDFVKTERARSSNGARTERQDQKAGLRNASGVSPTGKDLGSSQSTRATNPQLNMASPTVKRRVFHMKGEQSAAPEEKNEKLLNKLPEPASAMAEPLPVKKAVAIVAQAGLGGMMTPLQPNSSTLPKGKEELSDASLQSQQEYSGSLMNK